jgi:hypothetical protein
MFTFGRQREKECALHYLKDPQQAHLMEAVVDAVHDLLEGRMAPDAIRPVLSRAFIEGGTGVWEQTGSWLGKLIRDQPTLESLWSEFSSHPELMVRLRAACFINEMSPILARDIVSRLRLDRSKKVREMAEARLEELES